MPDKQTPRQFSSWYRLDRRHLDEHAPDEPAAIQVRTAEGLLDYPNGHSAMVCYLYATESAHSALAEFFSDELEDPGASELGVLEFRIFDGRDAREWLTELMYKFESTFGAWPTLNNQQTNAPDRQSTQE
jgi:hypothetical protein